MKAGTGSLSIAQKGMACALAAVLALSLVGIAPASAFADTAKPSFEKSKVTTTYKTSQFINKLNNATGKITWSSSNKKAATVSSSGKVTIKGVGKTTIKAKTAGKTYQYKLTVNPRTPKISKVSRTSKGFKITWAKRTSAEADGYQVRYATNKSMKSAKKVKVAKASTTSAKVSTSKSATTYYVQVRAYKKVGGTTYYSAWSDKKAFTTDLKTSDAKLNSIVNNLLDKKIGRNGDASLKKAFNYVSDLAYSSEGGTEPKGNWTVSGAKKMYNNKGGNCYESAALFYWLATGLGYDAKAISGKFAQNSGDRAHGWVEIKKDGKTYFCDTNFEHTLRQNPATRTSLEEQGRNTNLFMETYKNSGFTYKK